MASDLYRSLLCAFVYVCMHALNVQATQLPSPSMTECLHEAKEAGNKLTILAQTRAQGSLQFRSSEAKKLGAVIFFVDGARGAHVGFLRTRIWVEMARSSISQKTSNWKTLGLKLEVQRN